LLNLAGVRLIRLMIQNQFGALILSVARYENLGLAFYLKLAIGLVSWWLNIMEVVLGTDWCTHALMFVCDIS
jgi:hypothetical protein